jgi:hypothetical protein
MTTSGDDGPHRVTVQNIEVLVENRATLERRLDTLEAALPQGVTFAEGVFADPAFWEAVAAFQAGR